MPNIILLQAATTLVPHLLLGATAPWWGLTVLTLVTGIVLVWLTEAAKSRFARPKTLSELRAADEAIAHTKRGDEQAFLATVSLQYSTVSQQYASILKNYETIVLQNAENAATVKIQSSEIDRLRSDVKDLQTENVTLRVRLEAAAILSSEMNVLQARVSVLEAQIQAKDKEIARLEGLLHVEREKIP